MGLQTRGGVSCATQPLPLASHAALGLCRILRGVNKYQNWKVLAAAAGWSIAHGTQNSSRSSFTAAQQTRRPFRLQSTCRAFACTATYTTQRTAASLPARKQHGSKRAGQIALDKRLARILTSPQRPSGAGLDVWEMSDLYIRPSQSIRPQHRFLYTADLVSRAKDFSHLVSLSIVQCQLYLFVPFHFHFALLAALSLCLRPWESLYAPRHER